MFRNVRENTVTNYSHRDDVYGVRKIGLKLLDLFDEIGARELARLGRSPALNLA